MASNGYNTWTYLFFCLVCLHLLERTTTIKYSTVFLQRCSSSKPIIAFITRNLPLIYLLRASQKAGVEGSGQVWGNSDSFVHEQEVVPLGSDNLDVIPASPHNCPIKSPVDFTGHQKENYYNQAHQIFYTSTPRYDIKSDVPQEPCFEPLEGINITVKVNADVHIPCTVRNIDFSSTVMSWWREGSLRELTVGHQVASQRYSIDKSDPRSWTLVIRNVTPSDAGNYICQINLSKLKEKFYRLSVLPLETTKQDSTKLNDEYVKDEATPYKNMSHQDVLIEGKPNGVTSRPHQLTCIARFYQPDPSSTVLWFHKNPYQGTAERRYPRSPVTLEQMWKDPTDSSLEYNVSHHWLNKSQLISVLRLSRLSLKSAGLWRCAKFSRNFFEPTGEATFYLRVFDPKEDQVSRFLQGAKQPRYVPNKPNSGPPLYNYIPAYTASILYFLFHQRFHFE